MAEPVVNRTIIALDDTPDSRYERISSVCQRIVQTLDFQFKRAREEVAKLTEIDLTDDDLSKIRSLPPPPRGSRQVALIPPLPRPSDEQIASIMTQANMLVASIGQTAADCRYWSQRWAKSKIVHIRESWCQIMRIVRSIAELLERFVSCVVPFWELFPDKNRYVFGFVENMAATIMPYFGNMVDTWGQWAYNTSRRHADGCVCVDLCSLFAPEWLVASRRGVVLPYIDVMD